MRAALALCVALAAAGAQGAERRMIGAFEQRNWNGVGRLNFGGGFCTAALVAADLAVTAAHCLFVPATGARRRPERMKFVAGYRVRRSAGVTDIASYEIHPSYDYARKVNQDGVAADLALLRLSAPLTADPFALAPGLAAGDTVTVVSYGRDRREIASIQPDCAVTRRLGGMVVLTCDAIEGISGAPVFRMVDGAPRIVAVISATGWDQGGRRAFAVVLDGALGALLAAQ